MRLTCEYCWRARFTPRISIKNRKTFWKIILFFEQYNYYYLIMYFKKYETLHIGVVSDLIKVKREYVEKK